MHGGEGCRLLVLVPSPGLAVVLASCVALAACGARSDLDGGVAVTRDAGPARPDGGACSGLAVAGAELVLDRLDGFDALTPAIVPLDAAGSLIAVVAGMEDYETGGDFTLPIVDTTLAPWGSWPPAPSALHTLNDDGGGDFAVAPAGDGTLSALFYAESSQLLHGLMYDRSVAPGGPAPLKVLDPLQASAGFIAHQADWHLVGYDRRVDTGAHVFVADLFQGDGMLDAAIATVCSGQVVVAAAVPSAGGFLVAAATSAPAAQCPTMPGTMLGPATDLQILIAAPGAQSWLTEVSDVPGGDPVTAVALMPRSDGAWLFSQRQGQDMTTAAVEARRIGSDGTLAGESVVVVPPGRGAFAVAASGDGFALAWFETASAIGVGLFDGQGQPRATTLFSPDASAVASGPYGTPASIGVLVSSGGDTVLVAWPAMPVDGTTGARVHLARFAPCQGA